MDKIGVIGAGSWGTALAQTLAGKGYEVFIYDVNKEHLDEMKENRENVRYLPGVHFSDNLHIVYSAEEALTGAKLALFSAPAQFFRSAAENAVKYLTSDTLIVNVAKGIEQKSLKRMSEIAEEVFTPVLGTYKYVVLSGPSHAEEVGRAMPTTVSVASENMDAALEVQDIFMTNRFRIYTSNDVIGLELGGALKNIIALGAGISDGMGFGDNAKAALMTRGIAEITRLGVKLGADVRTFNGLAGIGDLIVTCTSMHSRNRRCGIMIGEGMNPQDAVREVGMVVEGMYTTEAAYELAKQAEVEMPITEAIYDVINGKIDAREALEALMGREKRHETENH